MSKKSIQAYREAAQSGKIKTTEQRIYAALYEAGPLDLHGFRRHPRTQSIKHQTLTAVLSAMQDEGLIFQQDESGNWRIVWTLQEQAEAIEQRRKTRFLKWWAVGNRENFFKEYQDAIRNAF